MMRPDDFSRLELNLRATLENYKYFRSLLEPQTKLLVLVKANAYGHGAVEFGAMMQRAGADYLAVAYPVEGLELRRNGISLPIIVLTAGTDFYPEIIETRLEPSIPNLYSLRAFVEQLRELDLKDYPIHIKLDTGMHRLGFMTGELPELIDYLKETPEVKVKSVFSHLCVAEDPDQDAFTLGQIELFQKNAQALSDGIGYMPMRHILNSAGIERFPQYQMDMVRLGIGIYGVSAVPGKKLTVDQVKVVILGQDPYHGPGQAMGLSFSVPDGVPAPPSLRNIFQEVETDLGIRMSGRPNLEKWARQGVLLLNAVLTVQAGQPTSHSRAGWQEFTDAVIRYLSENREGIVFLLWGRFAAEKAALIDSSRHHVLLAAHPSPLARGAFFGCRHFSKTNQILVSEGKTPIDWQL